jgi:signal transduction histidine kinase
MSSYRSIIDKPGALLLLIAAFCILIGQIVALLLSLREKRNAWRTLCASLHLVLGFLLFVFILNGYDAARFPKMEGTPLGIEGFLYDLPWAVFVFAQAVFALILVFEFCQYRRYRITNVTSSAIRHTVDLLPEGICISDRKGTVLLSNLRMDTLCRELTGERISDARRFWEGLESISEDREGKRLVRTQQGEVWLFSKGVISTEGEDFDRISAANITERYDITEELRKKNNHLMDIQRRMKEAAELSKEMFVKQEESAARTALHNQLGQVLLMGRHYIEHPDNTDAAMVALITKQMNSFLLGESTDSRPDSGDELAAAIRMAGSIGVTVELMGEAPEEEGPRSLLAAAIRECSANAVKHAEGDRVGVLLQRKDKLLEMTLTNNGAPPKGPVAESGGLLSLRRSVEEAGGKMTVESAPVFSLTISVTGA